MYSCAGLGIRYFRGQFLPGRQVLGGKFCPGIRLLAIFVKKCVIFDKRVKKVICLLKTFNFGTIKVMKTCPVIRFLAVICPGIRFFWEILPSLGVVLTTLPYLPLLGSCPPPPRIHQVVTCMLDKNTCIYKPSMLQ